MTDPVVGAGARGAWSFTEVVRARRMVRVYTGAAVAPAVLGHLLDLALRAPSAGNAQGVELVVLTAAADREVFWRASADDVDAPDRWLAGMMSAPVLVLVVAHPGAYRQRYAAPDKTGRLGEAADTDHWQVPWWDVDAGMAAQLLLLGAVEAGLGACLFGVPAGRHDAVREAFAVPVGHRVVAVVSVGHPAPEARSGSARRARRRVDRLHDGAFGRPVLWAPTSLSAGPAAT